MAAHSSILAWKIQWTEEPGRTPGRTQGVIKGQTRLSDFTFTFLSYLLLCTVILFSKLSLIFRFTPLILSYCFLDFSPPSSFLSLSFLFFSFLWRKSARGPRGPKPDSRGRQGTPRPGGTTRGAPCVGPRTRPKDRWSRRVKMCGTDAWMPARARNACVPGRFAVGRSKGAALLPRKLDPEAGPLRMVSTKFPTNRQCVTGEGHS